MICVFYVFVYDFLKFSGTENPRVRPPHHRTVNPLSRFGKFSSREYEWSITSKVLCFLFWNLVFCTSMELFCQHGMTNTSLLVDHMWYILKNYWNKWTSDFIFVCYCWPCLGPDRPKTTSKLFAANWSSSAHTLVHGRVTKRIGIARKTEISG